MDRLGQKAAVVFLALGLIALLIGLFDMGNGPLSYIFAVLLGMPWTFLVDAIATKSQLINVLMMVFAMCMNAFIIYLAFSWIGKRIGKKSGE